MGSVTYMVDFLQERSDQKLLNRIEQISLAGMKERTCLRVVIEGKPGDQWDQQEMLERLRHFRWAVKVLSSGETASTGQAETCVELHEACAEESNQPWLAINVEPFFPSLDPTNAYTDRLEITLTTRGEYRQKFRNTLPGKLKSEKQRRVRKKRPANPFKLRLVVSR